MWELLNRIAVVGGLIGIPATLLTYWKLHNEVVIVYDMYREINESGGYTLSIGSFSRKEYRRAKKTHPNREFHIKGTPQDDDSYWR